MEYYYYTRWTFHQTPDGLDNCGPYHSTTISSRPPDEFLKDNRWENIAEFYYVSFPSRDEMDNYYALLFDEPIPRTTQVIHHWCPDCHTPINVISGKCACTDPLT